MITKPKKQTISVHISPNEKDILRAYTDTPLELIRRIDEAIAEAKLKRDTVKKVTVHYTVNELNTIIAKIALSINQHNLIESVRYMLSSLFGRLATSYNLAISS